VRNVWIEASYCCWSGLREWVERSRKTVPGSRSRQSRRGSGRQELEVQGEGDGRGVSLGALQPVGEERIEEVRLQSE
jgi:hypothetical protein